MLDLRRRNQSETRTDASSRMSKPTARPSPMHEPTQRKLTHSCRHPAESSKGTRTLMRTVSQSLMPSVRTDNAFAYCTFRYAADMQLLQTNLILQTPSTLTPETVLVHTAPLHIYVLPGLCRLSSNLPTRSMACCIDHQSGAAAQLEDRHSYRPINGNRAAALEPAVLLYVPVRKSGITCQSRGCG